MFQNSRLVSGVYKWDQRRSWNSLGKNYVFGEKNPLTQLVLIVNYIKKLKRISNCRLNLTPRIKRARDSANSGDLGKFYGHVNNRIFHKSGIASLKDKQGNFVLNDLAKANLLNNYFTGVGTVDNGSTPEFVHPTIPVAYTQHFIHTVAFNSSLILTCIKKRKRNPLLVQTVWFAFCIC